MPRPHAWRLTAGVVFVAALAVVTTACVPEPAATSAPSPSTSATAPSPTPSPTETAAPGDDGMALPATCEGVYTPEMLATLQTEVAPLNDPGTTMSSTENATALEILASGTPTLRCSWGPPSERGMSTNITIVTPDQSTAIADALTRTGFSSTELGGGTLYEYSQQTVTQDDVLVELGETHYLRGDGWVATRWINVQPEGYTEAIVQSLWG